VHVQREADEWLMACVAGGDRKRLAVLVRRYATPLLTFIVRMVGDHHRGEELFQEVWLAVWVRRRQYRPALPFKPWLHQIAVNKCREAMRRKTLPVLAGESAGALAAGATADTTDPHDAAAADDAADLLAEAVLRLPEKQRAVVAMRVWQQMAFAEIAEVLGRREGTRRRI